MRSQVKPVCLEVMKDHELLGVIHIDGMMRFEKSARIAKCRTGGSPVSPKELPVRQDTHLDLERERFITTVPLSQESETCP